MAIILPHTPHLPEAILFYKTHLQQKDHPCRSGPPPTKHERDFARGTPRLSLGDKEMAG